MFELANGHASWLAPKLLGQSPEFDALLPYWLGAWAMRVAPAWVSPDFAARVPFLMLLALTLLATWYAVYSLARSPQAQPVPFAFGGEANPVDYARAIADAGLLALVACLGLAQFSHETTPSLAQISFTALSFYGTAAVARQPVWAGASLVAGLAGMALSGAPAMAVLFGAGGLAITVFDRDARDLSNGGAHVGRSVALLCAALLLAAGIATGLDLWQWRIHEGTLVRDWRPLGRLLLWFTWPAGPLAVYTLWRWRRQL